MEIQQGTGEGGWVPWVSANRHEAPIQIGAKFAGPADFGRTGWLFFMCMGGWRGVPTLFQQMILREWRIGHAQTRRRCTGGAAHVRPPTTSTALQVASHQHWARISRRAGHCSQCWRDATCWHWACTPPEPRLTTPWNPGGWPRTAEQWRLAAATTAPSLPRRTFSTSRPNPAQWRFSAPDGYP